MTEEYEHINDDLHDGWWLRPEYSEEEPKLRVNKAEIAKLVKEYKKIKKNQKSNFAQIKKLDK